MENFNVFDLPEAILERLQALNFITPTPIQAKAIPVALKGQDVLGSAQTGTGKTLAFGLPLIAHLYQYPERMAVVVTPTRELAQQVLAQLNVVLGNQKKIKAACLIGGEPMGKQFAQLRQKPRVLVGTPGRINDHIQRGSLKLSTADFLVLDETDRMLDMGFTGQIEQIMKHMPKKRQTLLFSATIFRNIEKIAQQYLHEPVRVAINQTLAPEKNIKQVQIKLNEADKHDQLLSTIEDCDGSIIIFAKTKYSTAKLAKKLRQLGHRADAIHGDLRQNKRDRVIAAFRDAQIDILVATDVAARGLDIPHVAYVINHDLPQCPEDYIHRIGRTGRAGAKGEALNFITPQDQNKWRAIERLLNPDKKSSQKPKKHYGKSADRAGNRGGKQGSFERKQSGSGKKHRSFSKERRDGFDKRDSSSSKEKGSPKKFSQGAGKKMRSTGKPGASGNKQGSDHFQHGRSGNKKPAFSGKSRSASSDKQPAGSSKPFKPAHKRKPKSQGNKWMKKTA